jgi:Tfp pilus assembly protein PilO
MKLNHEKKIITLLALISVITLVIILGIIWPTINYIKKLEEDTTSLRNYLEKKYEHTKSIRTSKQQIEEISSAVNQYSNYMFFQGDELKLITILENIAVANKITQKIDNSNLDKLSGDTINISLTLNGDYFNILKYLSTLEKEKYYFNINHLQLSSAVSPQNNNPDATIMNLDIKLYANKH